MTVLLSTAYLGAAERCDEVILMHDGEVLGHGLPEEFRHRSQGRAYRVKVPGVSKRVVQGRLAALEPIVDALIQGDGVRLVMESDTPPAPAGASGSRVFQWLGCGFERVTREDC